MRARGPVTVIWRHVMGRALNTSVLSWALAELGCLDTCHYLGGLHINWGLPF